MPETHYVSQDVYNAVQSMFKIVETFATGNRIARFAPQGPDDVEKAAVSTAYRLLCVQGQRRFSVFSTVISDALLARVGIQGILAAS